MYKLQSCAYLKKGNQVKNSDACFWLTNLSLLFGVFAADFQANRTDMSWKK